MTNVNGRHSLTRTIPGKFEKDPHGRGTQADLAIANTTVLRRGSPAIPCRQQLKGHKLLILAVIDRSAHKLQKFMSFELLAAGDRWGATSENGRNRGFAPLGLSRRFQPYSG